MPAGQCKHSMALEYWANLPPLQSEHSLPVVAWNWPATQSEHTVAGDMANVPLAHVSQDSAL